MWKFLPILLFFFACKKNETSAVQSIIMDSAESTLAKYYRLDVNMDNVADIKIGWYQIPGQTSITIYYAVALHPTTKIHVTQQTGMLCRDTSGPVGYQAIQTYNCSGGPKLFRTDTFYATPNLDSTSLHSTQVNAVADSNLIYKRTWRVDMPSPPFFYNEDWGYGFYNTQSPGYLLMEVNGKRYGLDITSGHMIGKLIKVDP